MIAIEVHDVTDMNTSDDDDGVVWHNVLPAMITSDARSCRLWWDQPMPERDADGNFILDRAYLDCVDCHATVHLGDFFNGMCARDPG